MPRRLPVRPAKIIGNLFVLFVLIVISTIYYTYVGVVFGPKIIGNLSMLTVVDNYLIMGMLAVFHLLFLMLLWAFFQSMTTDPGQVPVFWGFHLGDAENKRRRYCLMCNVFKPERCHHCSACNRCVLNMDHHCPWINNCIGFWNRKYFLLLLIYVLLTTYYVAVTMFYEFLMTVKWEIDAFYYTNTPHDRQLLIRALMI
jgi:palmitoyltransferase ZDHHC2/15/20